jgi:hypothetical protein
MKNVLMMCEVCERGGEYIMTVLMMFEVNDKGGGGVNEE